MWRQLEPYDFDAVMALRDTVLRTLPDPDMYVREDDEATFVFGHLGEFGECIGYFEGDRLVAYLALTTDLAACGEDVEFAACAPTSNDVAFAVAMVLPEYRGRQLHRDGIRRHIAVAQARGAQRGFAQISPRNHRSLRNYLWDGFRCTQAVHYPDGRQRLLVERDLLGGSDATLIEDIALVDMDDFDGIRSELTGMRAGHSLLPAGAQTLMVVGTGHTAAPRRELVGAGERRAAS